MLLLTNSLEMITSHNHCEHLQTTPLLLSISGIYCPMFFCCLSPPELVLKGSKFHLVNDSQNSVLFIIAAAGWIRPIIPRGTRSSPWRPCPPSSASRTWCAALPNIPVLAENNFACYHLHGAAGRLLIFSGRPVVEEGGRALSRNAQESSRQSCHL